MPEGTAADLGAATEGRAPAGFGRGPVPRSARVRAREGATVTTNPVGAAAGGALLPGAEPFEAAPGGAYGRVGVLLCHGFTGSPQSLRPWARHLAEAGFRVSLPLLPGHGTRWKDLQSTTWQDWYAEVDKALRVLREDCDSVFVAGLSMGGGLALRLA